MSIARSTQGADPIAAVREQDARGEFASIFEDIRKTLQIPLVNLVWRHLATFPGALEWVWRYVKPLYAQAEFNSAADSLTQLPTIEQRITPLPRYVLRSVDVTESDIVEIKAMLDDYTHANARAVLSLSTARLGLMAKLGHEHSKSQHKSALASVHPETITV